MKNIIKTVFYGNIFYGLCTVALSIETNLQHGIALNSTRFYILVFLATALYYSRIYYRSSAIINVDDRTDWYRRYRPTIAKVLVTALLLLVGDILLMAFVNLEVLYHLSAYYWFLLAMVPLLGVMYISPILPLRRLRRVGWLKPFVIGFVWSGVVTIFPVLFWQLRHQHDPGPDIILKTLLWLQNFLFISTLAIVFDIKDYNSDKKHNLNTYPTTYGIKNTVWYIIVPLTILSWAILLFFQWKYNRPLNQTLIQSIPYLILLLMSKTLVQGKKLLFYLIWIDGLMFLKGLVGIASILLF